MLRMIASMMATLSESPPPAAIEFVCPIPFAGVVPRRFERSRTPR
jgi:hypothetical protein